MEHVHDFLKGSVPCVLEWVMIKEAFLNYLIYLDVQVIQILNEFYGLLPQGLVIYHCHPALCDIFYDLVCHEFKNDRMAMEDSKEYTIHQLNLFELFVLKHMDQASAFFFDDLLGMICDKFIFNDFYQRLFSFLLIVRVCSIFFNF